MRCPECGNETSDDDAEFCARCGASLRPREGDVTARLEAGAPARGGSTRLGAASSTGESDTGRLVEEERPEPAPGAPERSAAGAALAFLVLLSTGAVLLLAAKLQSPAFGASADPLDVFTAVVILGLGSIRAPVHLGGLVFTLLPLGAATVIAVGVVWATRTSFRAASR